MCSGWGNTRHAAERNASIFGMEWLRDNWVYKLILTKITD
jgi:hypothetical protein